MCPGEERCPQLRSRGKGARLLGTRSRGALVCCSRSEGGPESHRLLRPRPPLAGPAQPLDFPHPPLPCFLSPLQFPCFSARFPSVCSLKPRQKVTSRRGRHLAASRLRHSLDGWAGESSPFCPPLPRGLFGLSVWEMGLFWGGLQEAQNSLS